MIVEDKPTNIVNSEMRKEIGINASSTKQAKKLKKEFIQEENNINRFIIKGCDYGCG